MSGITAKDHSNLNNSDYNISIFDNQQQNASKDEHLALESHEKELNIMWILILSLMMVLGLIVNYNFFNNVTKEKHKEKGQIIQRIIKTYAIIQSIGWPLLICVAILLKIDYMSCKIMPPGLILYVLECMRFLYVCLRVYVGFNSLIIAICRYCFIVYDENVSQYGVNKTRKILICLSLAVPLAISILFCLFVEPRDLWSSVETNEYNKPSYLYRSHELATNSADKPLQLPLYNLVHTHVPSYISSGVKLFCYGSILLIASNLVEGAIYAHIYVYGRRSENKEFLNVALSEISKLKRRRRTMVNVQMTVFSWCLEFLAGAIAVTGLFFNKLMICVAFDICLNFVLIPGSYMLNNQVNKTLIIADGWCQVIKNTFCLRCTRKVESAQVGDIESSNKQKVVPQPIPSISGNIVALSQKNRYNKTKNVLQNVSERTLQEDGPNLEENNIAEQNSSINQVPSVSRSRSPSSLPTLQTIDSMLDIDDIEIIVLPNNVKHTTNESMVKYVKKNNYVSF